METDIGEECGCFVTSEQANNLWWQGLNQGNRIGFRVASGSMLPTLAIGDRIFVESFAPGRDPRIGEIVLLRTDDGWLVHRIVGSGGSGAGRFYLQKGDAGHHARQISPAAIAGRVVTIEKSSGAIHLDSWSQAIIRGAVGRSYQLIEWLLVRGAGIGWEGEGGASSAARVRASGWVRRLESGIATLGYRLSRRRAKP